MNIQTSPRERALASENTAVAGRTDTADAARQIPWLDPALYPFQHRYLTVEGCKVHYIEEGAGPTLLFIHSGPCWSFQYRDIIRVLRTRFRCVAPDMPGFGLSDAPAGYGYTLAEHSRVLEALVDKLGLSDITMAVHATGGPVGFGIAARRPELFRAFIVSNTFAWSPMSYPFTRKMFRIMGSRPIGFLIVHANFLVRIMMRFGIGKRRGGFSAAERRAYRGPFIDRKRRRSISDALRDISRNPPFYAEVERGLAKLHDMPMLILWGEFDNGRRVDWPAEWERRFPAHRSAIVKGAAHFIHDDAPAEVTEEILKWWPSVEASSASAKRGNAV